MSQLGSPTLASPRAAGLTDVDQAEDRLPMAQVLLVVGGSSALLWLAIAVAVRWLLAWA